MIHIHHTVKLNDLPYLLQTHDHNHLDSAVTNASDSASHFAFDQACFERKM